ncbi:hypothetical protein AVEN_139598-1 [Araneus ventricosus]|uniref:Uncharacterized protein n=1 Tax=Araneus ventricosus TaxID=182803 RepID=A0A4Y2WMF7_ARAVE|nr:hypothetical protein AVEN_125706-1 [Araneus ventricosus]GBO37139.1 hypothetical protein AVEN_139598-1 [Araneus ventricosus]
MSGINVKEYLTADGDIMVFAEVTEEDVPSEITNERENDHKEDDDDDTDPSQSLLTSQELLQSIQSLQAFFSSLSSTNDDHFRALDSMQTMLVDLQVLDFFDK